MRSKKELNKMNLINSFKQVLGQQKTNSWVQVDLHAKFDDGTRIKTYYTDTLGLKKMCKDIEELF